MLWNPFESSLAALIFESSPWRLCLCHPHQVHVAGQQGEVSRGLGLVNTVEVTVGQQNVNNQLQIGLPSDGLPEQNHRCTWKPQIDGGSC